MKLSIKNIFLMDGLGALVSAFMLGVVLVKLQAYIGIPKNALYILASFPVIFAIYDFSCHLIKPKKVGLFINIIAIANLMYCFVSIYYLIQHQQQLSTLGWMYFIGELIILVVLIIMEFKLAKTTT